MKVNLKDLTFSVARGLHTFVSYWSNYKVIPKPSVMYLEVTYRCTLKCSFCDRWIVGPKMIDQELKLDEIKALLKDARRIGVGYLGLTGGEAFLRRELPEIGRFARSLGIRVAVASNGSLINERNIEEISRSFDAITISVDGAKKETHDQLRGVEGSYDWALRALGLFKKWSVPTAVNMVVHNENFREIEEYIKMFSDLGIRVQLTPIHDSRTSYFNVKESLKRIDVKEFSEEWSRLSKKYSFLRRGYYRNVPLFLSSPRDLHDVFTCFAGSATFFVSPIGDIFPCEFLRKKMGNIREKSLPKIWEEAQALRRMISSPQRPCVCWAHCATPLNGQLTKYVALKKGF